MSSFAETIEERRRVAIIDQVYKSIEERASQGNSYILLQMENLPLSAVNRLGEDGFSVLQGNRVVLVEW